MRASLGLAIGLGLLTGVAAMAQDTLYDFEEPFDLAVVETTDVTVSLTDVVTGEGPTQTVTVAAP